MDVASLFFASAIWSQTADLRFFPLVERFNLVVADEAIARCTVRPLVKNTFSIASPWMFLEFYHSSLIVSYSFLYN